MLDDKLIGVMQIVGGLLVMAIMSPDVMSLTRTGLSTIIFGVLLIVGGFGPLVK